MMTESACSDEQERLNYTASTFTGTTSNPSFKTSRPTEETLDDKIETVYTELGGMGRMQIFALIAMILCLSGANWWFYIQGYLT